MILVRRRGPPFRRSFPAHATARTRAHAYTRTRARARNNKRAGDPAHVRRPAGIFGAGPAGQIAISRTRRTKCQHIIIIPRKSQARKNGGFFMRDGEKPHFWRLPSPRLRGGGRTTRRRDAFFERRRPALADCRPKSLIFQGFRDDVSLFATMFRATVLRPFFRRKIDGEALTLRTKKKVDFCIKSTKKSGKILRLYRLHKFASPRSGTAPFPPFRATRTRPRKKRRNIEFVY